MAPSLVPARDISGRERNYSRNMQLDEVLQNIRSQFSPLDRQRRQLDLVKQLNTQHKELLQKDAQLEARIESFEIAFRMQTEATDAFDISKEPEEVQGLYGKTDLGSKLLVARRLVGARRSLCASQRRRLGSPRRSRHRSPRTRR
jgi:hypothetical protein